MKQLIVIVSAFLLTGCFNKKTTEDHVVAKVYDYVLTREELQENLLETSTVVDSLKLTRDYIKNWSRQKLLYKNSLINIENTEELDVLVKEYREELYVSYYKNALIKKKLDTLVLDKEIDSFYIQNKASFKLKEDLIQFKYIHLDKKNRKRTAIRKIFKSDDYKDILNNYEGYSDFYFNDSLWVSLKNIYLQKPTFPVLSSSELLETKKIIEKRGVDRSLYYIKIKKTLKKGSFAPVEYVRPTIKNILLHKNKIKFFDQMEQVLIDKAVKQKKYEIY